MHLLIPKNLHRMMVEFEHFPILICFLTGAIGANIFITREETHRKDILPKYYHISFEYSVQFI